MGRWLDLMFARRPVAASPSRQRGALPFCATANLFLHCRGRSLAVLTVAGPPAAVTVRAWRASTATPARGHPREAPLSYAWLVPDVPCRIPGWHLVSGLVHNLSGLGRLVFPSDRRSMNAENCTGAAIGRCGRDRPRPGAARFRAGVTFAHGPGVRGSSRRHGLYGVLSQRWDARCLLSRRATVEARAAPQRRLRQRRS